MPSEANTPASPKAVWKPAQMLVLCAVCLIAGIVVGYLAHGSAPVAAASAPEVSSMPSVSNQAAQAPSPHQGMGGNMPSLEDMRHMADKKAEPLLAKLKTDPKNPQLLNQVGLVYKSAHQFDDAAKYFEQSLQSDPKNIGVRADYASCLYFTGNVDGALAQLNKSLTYDPKHAGTLMNIGIIKLKGKDDPAGAIEAWEKVLKYHPDFPQKAMVEQMIAQAKEGKKTGSPKG
jgi:tetratricopeptide (TPR) repeat protein